MLIEATCKNLECREQFYPDLNWSGACPSCKQTNVYWTTDEVNDVPEGYEEFDTEEE